MYEAQRRKPLNEHLEAQLLFFCVNNYPAEHAQGMLINICAAVDACICYLLFTVGEPGNSLTC
jgi:hypothetical protein